jgi:multiple sugar transport system ATP-binding protein
MGAEVTMGIRPEDIYDKVYAPNASADNTIVATVEVVEQLGSESNVYLTTGKTPFIAKMDSEAEVEVNQEVELVLDMNKAHFFDSQTEAAII